MGFNQAVKSAVIFVAAVVFSKFLDFVIGKDYNAIAASFVCILSLMILILTLAVFKKEKEKEQQISEDSTLIDRFIMEAAAICEKYGYNNITIMNVNDIAYLVNIDIETGTSTKLCPLAVPEGGDALNEENFDEYLKEIETKIKELKEEVK